MNARKGLISAAMTLAGCAASAEVGTTQTTSAELSQNDAADQVVKAHCTHFYGCGELGGSHRFRTYDQCTHVLKNEMLRREQCQTIASAKLSACLDAIRTAGCAQPHSDKFQACAEQNLCR